MFQPNPPSAARGNQHQRHSTSYMTNARMGQTALKSHNCNKRRSRSSAGPGQRRHGQPCPHSNGDERRTNRGACFFFHTQQARRQLSVLIGVIVFAATVARRGGVLASSNPLELNGGSCLAMAGKGCVALAVDRRFGLEGQLVSTEAKRVLKVCRYTRE